MGQPIRTPDDGPMEVRRLDSDKIGIYVSTGKVDQSIECGEFNAFRVFASLAIVLGIELPAKVRKSILMT